MRMNPRASCDVFLPREMKLFKADPNAAVDTRASPGLQGKLDDYSRRFTKAQ
jgi:hypothetical protein